MDEVTLSEAAEMLNLPPRHLRFLVEIGEIPARTNRLLTFISLADIEIYQLRSRVTVNPAAPSANVLPHPRLATADKAASVPACSERGRQG
jgi:hypothetical protein